MRAPPKAFLSYAWESDELRAWVRNLATRLRTHGVDVTLDQWHTTPGDQLPHFMEDALRTNDYIVIICTPTYKLKSDGRRGGVGYEGDIMTAEAMANRNHRKFIPALRVGDWEQSAPSWLKGKYFVDLRDARFEQGYEDLLTTLLGTRQEAPPIGKPPALATRKPVPSMAAHPHPDDLIRILGVIVDEVTEPRRDGTPGSALYSVPFQLSRTPSSEWADLFVQIWNHPPRFTSMHRPGIARVIGSKVVLDGTTIEEVKEYHRDTLILVVKTVNEELEGLEERRRTEEERRGREREEHAARLRRLADDVDFS